MNSHEFYNQLVRAKTARQFEILLDAFADKHSSEVEWVPVGGQNRWNNSGIIGVSSDPGRALIERVTNAIDAVLEYEHATHNGLPDCRSPKEAASAWLKVPEAGLSALTASQRRELAQRVVITLEEGERRDARIVEVRDYGIGIAPSDLKSTILSLNESNKMQKHYLAGTYGQGGSSTFAACKYTLIASKHKESSTIGFTIIKYEDLPADTWKIGHYVYLMFGGDVLNFESGDFRHGTQVRHYGFDLHDYPSPLGPNSVYGLLNEMMFDPVMPMWLDNHIHDYRRAIKGSCTALQGAVDAEDNTNAPDLAHHIPQFYVPLGEHGGITMQYWVLAAPKKNNKVPIAAFLNQKKPIVLTINGQNHAGLLVTLIKKEAELPYLAQRLIVHVDCNSLKPEAKRALFTSTREDVRKGIVKDTIEQEIVDALKADDDLTRLNTEAYEDVMTKEDESAKQQMREEVSRILKLQGLEVAGSTGAAATTQEGDTSDRVAHPRKSRPKPKPIDLRDPPTFIRIVWEEDKSIPFYPGQSRYLRIETDAQSHYHDHQNPQTSRINIFKIGEGLSQQVATTPLIGGRMRAIFKCLEDADIGQFGGIRVELTSPKQPVIADERKFEIVRSPEAKRAQKKITLPPFRCVPIDENHEMWNTLDWPNDSSSVASETVLSNGELIIYYSTIFPRFAEQMTIFERRDTAQAKSFTERFQIWIAVHSLFLYEQQQSATMEHKKPEFPEEHQKWEREERCRSAALAVLFATREVKAGVIATDED